MDTDTDKAPDIESEGRWMTYAELAAARRIDKHSAVRLVIRHRWRRQKDNRGIQRIFVPAEWVSRDKAPDTVTDTATDENTDMSVPYRAALEAKDGEIAALRTVIEAKGGELAAVRSELVSLHKLLTTAEARANQADADRQATQEAMEELRQADEARKGRGRWARLRAAWRGE